MTTTIHASRRIQHALPIVAAAYGEKFGVRVRIGGDTACTDGHTITLPNVSGERFGDVLWGYLAHEAAHVRFSDFALYREVAGRSPLLASLTNIIEDCRIELRMIRLYPGTARTLQAVAAYMVEQGHYQVPGPQHHPARILEAYVLYFLQCRVVGQDAIEAVLLATQETYAAVFPKGVQVRLAMLLRRAGSLASTRDAVDLAVEMLAMLEQEAQQVQEAPQAEATAVPEPSSPGVPSSAQAADGAPSPPDVADALGSGAAPAAEVPMPAAGTDEHDGAAAPGEAPTVAAATLAGTEVLQRLLEDGDGEHHLADRMLALRAELDAGVDPYHPVRSVPTAETPDNDVERGRALLQRVAAASSRIQAQLLGLVQASQRSGTASAHHGKRLNRGQCHRLLYGDTRVFRRDAERQAPNTAVHLLVDMSGSMCNGGAEQAPYEVARDAALALALGLERIQGVNPAVTVFCNQARRPVWSVVRHGQKVRPNAGRFDFQPLGTTPMAEGIWYAAFELSKVREPRKLLLVITDGDPDDCGACLEVIARCEAGGIKCLGIGIGHTSVARLFTRTVSIERVEDLRNTLFRLMGHSLTGVQA